MSIDPPPPASQDNNTQPPDHGVHTRRHREKDSEIAELGGKIAIMHDLYRPFDQALLAGLAYDPNTPAENLNSSQLKYIEVWNLLDESIPGLEQRLRKEGTPGVSVVSNKLQGGRRSTLAACVDNVKKCSRDWGFVPPLPAEKRDRGFYNDVCGRLLCPAHLDWDDPTLLSVRAGLRNHEYRTYRIGSSRLPRLLWADGVMGDIPSVGFLRNELLLKTVALILRGPEAAKVVTSVGGPPMHYSVNSKPRAAIWHIYRVTPGCIAASATLLRFALSSHTRFSLSADQEQVNHEEVVTATIWPTPG
ncbi:hypothetical protein BC629DRAFT_1440802 [Irpex lacteus]|nr:hypothetical protein BC629DRAFT_1440802 [Irpex lacteus]